jgi:hypothetical protein
LSGLCVFALKLLNLLVKVCVFLVQGLECGLEMLDWILGRLGFNQTFNDVFVDQEVGLKVFH